MDPLDNFSLNIAGVSSLIGSPENKVHDSPYQQEGIVGDEIDLLDLPMSDEELITLKQGYEEKYAPYSGKIEGRQKQNKAYLIGTQTQTGLNAKTVPSNLLFEATATFVPQALAKNPEPVVFSDNTEEGKLASNDVKTVLQYLAMTLGLRKLLGIMVWHWSVYFNSVLKYGWDTKTNQITCDIRKRKNFLLDPDGYVNVFGDFNGWTGERIQSTAQELVDMYPAVKDYVFEQVGGKMGTQVVRTEWWTDEFSFTTYEQKVLDKQKNHFFNREDGKPNHFAIAKKPYTFLSVFNLQEQPDDFTNLIEQNIANQDRITSRDRQVDKNLAHSNNSLLMDDKSFTSETAHQGADALEQGDPILGPKGSVERLQAPSLPNGLLDTIAMEKETLRSIYGTQGLTTQEGNQETTARGMILNQSHDSSRIGGGMGDSLETVATSFFNWMLQMTYVFYDDKHYAAIMGSASAVEYVGLMMVGHNRQYVVYVTPDSMAPKDELSQVNQTLEMWKSQAIDPIGLFKGINDSDPMNSAKRLVMWTTNPQQYALTYFPETAQQGPPNSPDTQNPPDQIQQIQGQAPPSLSQEPASAALSNVPLH